MTCVTKISFSQVVINEVASTSVFTFGDEDGDYPDWIELYNAGGSLVSLHNYGITDDDQWNKWLLPDVSMAPGDHLIIFASAKNRPASGNEPTVNHWGTAVFDTSEWKYFIGVSAPPVDWNMIAFNESGWSTGTGGFGYGDGDDNTIVPAGTISVYYRKKISIADTANLIKAILSMDYDDAFVACLNGIEIARNNITGIPSYNTHADGDHESLLVNGMNPESFELDYELLHSLIINGTNVLAVEIHNTSAGSSDLTGRTFFHFGIGDTSQLYFSNPSWFNTATGTPELHTNFKIHEGETVSLYDASGTLLDSISMGGIFAGAVKARINDGGTWCFTDSPTPGAANNVTCYSGYAASPVFSLESGFYTSAQSTTISGSTIYYTTDGTLPTDLSTLYSGALSISSTQVIRARCYESGKLPGEPVSNSYLINEPTELNVLSIVATPGDLFNDGSGGPAVYDNMTGKANCTLEFFDASKVKQYEENASITPVGNYSIAFAQKSLQFIFDEDYGAKSDITYNMFKADKPGIDSYHGFRIRNMDDDWCCSRMKDIIADRMALPTHGASAGYNNVAVYINGEYWGHYCGRELLDASYCEDNFGADPDKVDMIKTNAFTNDHYAIEEGSDTSFYAMSDFIINNDMSDSASYATALQMIDMENWVDYFAAEAYVENIDWFSSYFFNNTRLFTAYNPDVRWKFVLWDLNDSQFDVSGNILAEALGYPYNPNRYTDMYNSLLENPDFRNYFINRFADLLNYYFTPEIIIPMIDSNAAEIISEIPAQSARWGSADLDDFNAAVASLKYFHNNRGTAQQNQINSYFGLNGKKSIELQVNPAGAGHIKISTITPETLPWTGIYFAGNPVTLTAIPNPGYTFSNWNANAFIADNNVISFTADVTNNTTFTANFTGSAQALDLAVSEINYNSDGSTNSGDWIELHNHSNYTLDVSDYEISDQQFYHVFNLPTGTEISPDGYLVICEDQQNFGTQHPTVYNVPGELSFGLHNDEDRIIVKDRFHDTLINFIYHDYAPWPRTPDGFGRTMESVAPSADPAVPESWFDGCMGGSPGAEYSACIENPVVTEINYHSADVLNTGDWLELYNKNATSLDVSNWSLRDENNENVFVFPSSTIIDAGSYLVVVNDDVLFSSYFPAVMNKIGDFDFGLGNSGDAIRLYDQSGILQLSVCFGDSTPWPTDADGGGYTLEDSDYNGNLNDAGNWFAGCYGGSPGTAFIPCAVIVNEINDFYCLVYPNPASEFFMVEIEGAKGEVLFELLDVSGRKISEQYLKNGTIKMDIRSLPKGIYWYKFMDQTGMLKRGNVIIQ